MCTQRTKKIYTLHQNPTFIYIKKVKKPLNIQHDRLLKYQLTSGMLFRTGLHNRPCWLASSYPSVLRLIELGHEKACWWKVKPWALTLLSKSWSCFFVSLILISWIGSEDLQFPVTITFLASLEVLELWWWWSSPLMKSSQSSPAQCISDSCLRQFPIFLSFSLWM